MSSSQAFGLLHPSLQRVVYDLGWKELRAVQELSIPAVLPGDRDVLITASTAAGKTEAAFLPALSRLVEDGGGLILSISPLKALINDQFGRLELLCQQLDIAVHRWHGDVGDGDRKRFLKRPTGVLLITPEALEAQFIRRGGHIPGLLAGLRYAVVDELHAFIGLERGKQLQSLLHRVEEALGRPRPRLGLSATLGDMREAAGFLRPGAGDRVIIVEAPSEGRELKVLVRGFGVAPVANDDVADEERVLDASLLGSIYAATRDSNNLIFPPSRAKVEVAVLMLNQICARNGLESRYWPHYGSLGKETREDAETALKSGERPANAVCTSTLELGIDIGAVKSVAQIGPAPTVASLRQRLGRSGRRPGDAAILRGFAQEAAIDDSSSLADRLRLNLVQLLAQVELLAEGWFEPPAARGLHLSTLIQQILSCCAERGGIRPAALYALLCGPGCPFEALAKEDFAQLLRHLGAIAILQQAGDGALLPGAKGEALVNDHRFYAAFSTTEEYRVMSPKGPLGTLPLSSVIGPGVRIVFAGRPWLVESVEDSARLINVIPSQGGSAPVYESGPRQIHRQVMQRMRDILATTRDIAFADPGARALLQEARSSFRGLDLGRRHVLPAGSHLLMVTWMGSGGAEAIAACLRRGGVAAVHENGIVAAGAAPEKVASCLEVLTGDELPAAEELLVDSAGLQREKWDPLLPEALLRKNFASLLLDLGEARAMAPTLTRELTESRS